MEEESVDNFHRARYASSRVFFSYILWPDAATSNATVRPHSLTHLLHLRRSMDLLCTSRGPGSANRADVGTARVRRWTEEISGAGDIGSTAHGDGVRQESGTGAQKVRPLSAAGISLPCTDHLQPPQGREGGRQGVFMEPHLLEASRISAGILMVAFLSVLHQRPVLPPIRVSRCHATCDDAETALGPCSRLKHQLLPSTHPVLRFQALRSPPPDARRLDPSTSPRSQRLHPNTSRRTN